MSYEAHVRRARCGSDGRQIQLLVCILVVPVRCSDQILLVLMKREFSKRWFSQTLISSGRLT